MKKVLLAAVLVVAPVVAFAADDFHGEVSVDTKAVGDNLEFTFKTEPHKGLEINLEGPWKLELVSHDGLTFAKTKYVRADLDEKTASYTVATTAKPAKSEGEIDYQLTTFVCTDAKTQCFREVHKGKAVWKVAGK